MDKPILINERARIIDGSLEGFTGKVIRYSHMDNIVEMVLDCDYDTAVTVPSELIEHIQGEAPEPTPAAPHILQIRGNNVLAGRREQHFQRFNNKDDAIAFFANAITNHPSLFDFTLYEVKKSVALPLHLKRQAEQKQADEETKRLKLKLLNEFTRN